MVQCNCCNFQYTGETWWGYQILRGTSLEHEIGPRSLRGFCHRSYQKKSTDSRIQCRLRSKCFRASSSRTLRRERKKRNFCALTRLETQASVLRIQVGDWKRRAILGRDSKRAYEARALRACQTLTRKRGARWISTTVHGCGYFSS